MSSKSYFAFLVTLVVLVFGTHHVNSANILGLFTSVSKSHSIQGHALLQGLAERGHNVTMVTAFPIKSPLKNYHQLKLKTDVKQLYFGTSEDFNAFKMSDGWGPSMVFQFFTNSTRYTDKIISDEVIQSLLRSNDKFDVVICVSFLNEAMYTIAHELGAPLIVYSLAGPTIFNDYLVGNPAPYAYVPMFALPEDMTFLERVLNTIISSALDLMCYFVYFPFQESVRAKNFPNAPTLYEIMTNTSLVLLNSHSSIAQPRPMVPNMVEIGGFQIREPKPLPPDLQEFMDNATNGVIFFSLGTNVLSKHMPVETKNTIVKVLSQLKEKVLWKWEDDVLPGKPENIKTSKWFPQTDLLAHPNLKMFITHGGWGSICEAIGSGVPLLGIPVMADQFKHVKDMEHQGYGKMLDLNNITYESLSWSINEVLNNPRYRNKMAEVQALYNDREIKPMDKVAYWVEYVIRTKGAKHLRSPALKLNQFQLLLLDVIGFLALTLGTIGFITYFSMKKVFKFIRSKVFKSSTSSNKKTN